MKDILKKMKKKNDIAWGKKEEASFEEKKENNEASFEEEKKKIKNKIWRSEKEKKTRRNLNKLINWNWEKEWRNKEREMRKEWETKWEFKKNHWEFKKKIAQETQTRRYF